MSNSPYPGFIFINLLAGLLLALGVGWMVIRITRRLGPMDLPGALPHKQHSLPTPLAGGIVLVLCLVIGGLAFNASMLAELWNILLPAVIVFAVGLWDDFKRLPAWVKSIGQIVAAVLLIALGTSVDIVPPGVLGMSVEVARLFDWAITLLWVVGITNAFNLIDSMDGLVLGTSGLGLAFLTLVLLASPQVALLRLLTIMLGICGGLYFYNHTPAKLFLGDSGAQTIGFLLAAVSIVFTPAGQFQASSWFLPILILGVPIFDVALVFFTRLRRRVPFYRSSLDHTYHRLVKLGIDSHRSVVMMHMATIILGCVAFIALDLQPLYANLIFALVCLAGVAGIIYLDRRAGS